MANEVNEASKIKIRRDTTENWASLDPVLDAGEIGIEWIDVSNAICRLKIGDGFKKFSDLPYFAGYDIPYDNLNLSSLPKINGIPLKGSLSLTELGIQPRGNYAFQASLDEESNRAKGVEQLLQSNIDEIDNKYSGSLLPSIEDKSGCYLKVVTVDNDEKIEWSPITESLVSYESLESILNNYTVNEEGKSLVDDADYNLLKQNVATINGYNIPLIKTNVESLNTEILNRVKYDELDEYIDETKLAKALTGKDNVPYSQYGYVSKDEFAEKADQSDLYSHTTAYNPHGISKEMIGLGYVDNTSDMNKPVSIAQQAALDTKQDAFKIKYEEYEEGGQIVKKPVGGVDIDSEGYLINTDRGSEAKWIDIQDTPDTMIAENKKYFQGDWDETNTNSINYIRNKPTIQYYELPIASETELGGIKLGDKFKVDFQGTLDLNIEVNDYTTLANQPSFMVPRRYKLIYKGRVNSISELPTSGQIIGDYWSIETIEDGDIVTTDYVWNVTQSWVVLSAYDKKLGYIINPGELIEYPFEKGMVASDLNLASLSVAKSIDERLEEEKADKTEITRIENLINEKFPTTDKYYTQQQSDNRYYTQQYLNDKFDTKVDVGEVYTKTDTYDREHLDPILNDITVRLYQVETNKEDTVNKTNVDIDTLSSDQKKSYYPTVNAVLIKTDKLTNDYNTKINNEISRATDAETAILDELHNDYYTAEIVDSKISSVYKYKGTKESYNDLPLSGNVEGDVWNIIEEDTSHGIKAGDNVAWVDEKDGVPAHWDVLAGLTNLQNYYNKTSVDALFVKKSVYNEKVDELSEDIEDVLEIVVSPSDYKDTVESYSDLPTENVEVNDMYIVRSTKSFYIWNGTEWVLQSSLLDKADKATSLEGYGIQNAYTKTATDALVERKISDRAYTAEVDAITAPMVFKKKIGTINELPLEGMLENDLYVIEEPRECLYWDGTRWVKQVSIKDLQDEIDEINIELGGKADASALTEKADLADFEGHTHNYNNPHRVTKSQVGLGNVDNTSDANKPISNATQLALNNKQNQLTSAQLSAVNSGVTPEKVEAYDSIVSDYDNLATVEELNEVKTTADTCAATLTTKADKATTYTKNEIDAKLSAAMHFKGTVATVEALPSSGQEIGDMYNVAENGSNYAWDGNHWDKLSETIDLTVYYTKTDIDGKISQLSTSISTGDDNLQAQINTKQAILTAGANLKIENNVISTTIGEGGTLYDKTSQLINDAGFITMDDVPDVYDASLTIQKNGSDLGTFSANSNTNTLVNITVPTTVAELSDHSNYALASSLGTVATSNDYNDLFNKPTVGNATLTLLKNGISLGTFSANATINNTINIEVPTTVASLSDANNYALKSDIPPYSAGVGISIDDNYVISSTQTSAVWGNIEGTLTDQTDLNNTLTSLQTAINEKQNNLVAGDNITIENSVISSQKSTISFKDWTK